MADGPRPWQVLSSKTVFSSPWLRLRQDQVRLPSGIDLDDYYVVEQFNFVKVFGYTAGGQIVFVRQYKHGAGRVVLELPAGFIEPGEDPAVAAAREMREETGYTGSLRQVGRWLFDPTRTATVEHLYFGQVTYDGPQRLDATEAIEVVLIPAADVPAMIDGGELDTLTSIAAVLYCLPLMR